MEGVICGINPPQVKIEPTRTRADCAQQAVRRILPQSSPLTRPLAWLVVLAPTTDKAWIRSALAGYGKSNKLQKQHTAFNGEQW